MMSSSENHYTKGMIVDGRRVLLAAIGADLASRSSAMRL
jgi:hypothetical protein